MKSLGSHGPSRHLKTESRLKSLYQWEGKAASRITKIRLGPVVDLGLLHKFTFDPLLILPSPSYSFSPFSEDCFPQ